MKPNPANYSVLILAPYPIGEAPSQRFRFEQYLAFLEETFTLEFRSFYSIRFWNILYQKGRFFTKIVFFIIALFNRFLILFQLSKFDLIFVHREILPIGPPVFEWIIVHVFRKKIIYDFDDAIWLPNSSDSNRFLVSKFKSHWKVKYIIKWSNSVFVGNDFLMSYAKKFNLNCQLIPTTVDLTYHKSPIFSTSKKKFSIGWTGSHSTVHYLKDIDEVLIELSEIVDFEFVVISDVPPQLKFKNVTFISWNKENEIEQLAKIDIGIMPLMENPWTLGKCAFKAIQFMALGKPCVVSPVGANCKVVLHNINGYHARSKQEWRDYLLDLLTNDFRYEQFSSESLKQIKEHFSVESIKHKYVLNFEKILCVES